MEYVITCQTDIEEEGSIGWLDYWGWYRNGSMWRYSWLVLWFSQYIQES